MNSSVSDISPGEWLDIGWGFINSDFIGPNNADDGDDESEEGEISPVEAKVHIRIF